MRILIILGLILSWLFIGYISTLIIFKILKMDIRSNEGEFRIWFIIGGLITPITGIFLGIMYLLVTVPYKLLFPEDKD